MPLDTDTEVHLKGNYYGPDGDAWERPSLRIVPLTEENEEPNPFDFSDIPDPEPEPAPEPEKPEPRRIRAISVPKLSTLKLHPRRFAMGNRYQYGVVTLGASPGGVGKTTLTIMEGVGWAIGRSLTGEAMRPRGAAWLITAEESSEEMYRRVLATCKFYEIDFDALEGKLFITSTQETPRFKVLRMGERGQMVATDDPEDVIAEMKENGIGYLGIDPFITTHEGDESNNGIMDTATRVFCRIANTTDAVVALYHHVVKDDDPEAHAGNLARVRGAGGIVNAARHAFTISSINRQTQERYELTDEEAIRVMRMDVGLKSNYVLREVEPLWFWRESVALDNAVYDEGKRLVWEADVVGVLRPFSMQNLTMERKKIEEAAKEPERAMLAQIVADRMTGDVMSVNTFVKDAVKSGLFGKYKDTVIREKIDDAVPMANEGARTVTVNGQSARLYRRRVANHSHAGLELVRTVIE